MPVIQDRQITSYSTSFLVSVCVIVLVLFCGRLVRVTVPTAETFPDATLLPPNPVIPDVKVDHLIAVAAAVTVSVLAGFLIVICKVSRGLVPVA